MTNGSHLYPRTAKRSGRQVIWRPPSGLTDVDAFDPKQSRTSGHRDPDLHHREILQPGRNDRRTAVEIRPGPGLNYGQPVPSVLRQRAAMNADSLPTDTHPSIGPDIGPHLRSRQAGRIDLLAREHAALLPSKLLDPVTA